MENFQNEEEGQSIRRVTSVLEDLIDLREP